MYRMKIAINNLLAFLIFLSPIVSGLDLIRCHEINDSTIEMIDCHESNDMQMSSLSSIDCCDTGNCSSCTHAFADRLSSLKTDVRIIHEPVLIVYQQTIPIFEFHPPFRPPIS